MGHLRITDKGLKLEGDSEFLQPLYAKEIQSRPGSPLFLQSSKNVSINILNGKNQVVTQLLTGSSGVEARSKMLEVKSNAGKLLFSADDQEIVIGAERLRVLGAEGAVFSNSVETPQVRADPFKELRGPARLTEHISIQQTSYQNNLFDELRELRSEAEWAARVSGLESPTRSLYMEAPKGVHILAEAGNIQATCRSEMRLESKDGEITLDAGKIKLPKLPQGTYSAAGTRQKVYELCVCPNGKLFLSQAGTGSTCQISTSVCL
ncbi:SGCD protein, partial [Atractosteus spatula]|nr:SGCD protein [Atractosteus spatula]